MVGLVVVVNLLVDVVDLAVVGVVVVMSPLIVVKELVEVGVVSCIVLLLATVMRYAGHSGSSSEANRTTQVPLILSREWWTGIVMTADDVIHCSMYSMTSLAVAGAPS